MKDACFRWIKWQSLTITQLPVNRPKEKHAANEAQTSTIQLYICQYKERTGIRKKVERWIPQCWICRIWAACAPGGDSQWRKWTPIHPVGNDFENFQKKWQRTDHELGKYKDLLMKAETEHSALDVKLKHAWNQVDVEIKQRQQAEADWKTGTTDSTDSRDAHVTHLAAFN